ncbi:MAG: nicotinamide mononucleotide transporter [Bacteroidales bacterium]|nr:nicotinamide mononucleotide transporter [Bacteroidales bacterium]
MTLIEGIATFFGLICVWLTIKENIWCWPTGLVQVFLYIFVFYNARLYSDMILHIIYVIISIYGWHHWLHPDRSKEPLKVTRTGKYIVLWIVICLFVAVIIGYFMQTYTNAAIPYADSFIMSASLVAQWLMARKKLESWLFWITVDVIAVGVYWIKELYITTGLYTVFLILAIMGFFEWRKSLLKEAVISQNSL